MKKKLKIILILILLSLFSYFFSKVCIFTLDMVKNKHIQKYLIKEVINVTINKDTNEEEFKVDFPKLIEKNKDTVGWIRYNNDKINYPVVKSTDNEYYLSKSFNKTNNKNGTIFMDFRNKSFDDKNVVLFGHAMLDGSMFGSLTDVFKKDFFTQDANNYIKIYTPNKILTYQIFSYYTIEKEEYYITTDFSTDEEFQNFISVITKRSYKDFKLDVNTDDKILTLSTCHGTGNTTKRNVIHAKLIK